jgi:hypothetical protein
MHRLVVSVLVVLMTTVGAAASSDSSSRSKDPNVTVVNKTFLLYRTPVGSKAVPNGAITVVASVDVHAYGEIRVAAGNRCGSPQPLTLLLTHQEGSEFVVNMDSITLAPCGQFSKAYDVPGTTIAIQTDQRSVASGTSDNFDLVFYGHD